MRQSAEVTGAGDPPTWSRFERREMGGELRESETGKPRMRVSEGGEELSDCLVQYSCVLHGGNGGGGGFNDTQ